MQTEIQSLATTDMATLYQAFSAAFADYELQLNRHQLEKMLRRRGFDPALSFAAFEGDRMVAFTFNGTGSYNGRPTAYDTGTGTLPHYRGKGWATAIFRHSLPFLREQGIRQYLLEVLQHNTAAVSVYRNLGFEVTREFGYYHGKKEDIVRPVQVPDPVSVRTVALEQMSDSVSSFWDFEPSWQNSLASVHRAADDFICVGAYSENRLVGYGMVEPAAGDIAQIAVDKPFRRKGIGSLLLSRMIERSRSSVVKVINTDTRCDSINGFLQANHLALTGKQFEMVLELDES